MKKQQIIIIGILLSIIPHLAVSAYAEIKEVNLHIDGLSCPFCAFGLEKKLNKVEAVATVDVHLKKAVTDITLKPGVPIDLKAIRKAVKKAGFTLRNIEVQVIGNISRNKQGFLVLESQGDKTRFILSDQDHADTKANLSSFRVLGADVEKRLSLAQKEGKLVLLQGVIHEHADLPLGLLIHKVEVKE